MILEIRAKYIMALALVLFGIGAFILLYVWARFYLWTVQYVGGPAGAMSPHMPKVNQG